VAQERWEARLDGLADDLTEERKERVRAGLEHLRARPWRRRLLGAG
jgi:hypothetical protein